MSRNTDMAAYIFFIVTICLTASVYSSYDFKVFQPETRTVNPDGSVLITCEHNASVDSVEDVRLNGISLQDKREWPLLCQMGMRNCKNITMYLQNPNKCFFIMLNIGAEAMNMEYECEFTVKKGNIDYIRKGTPTRLLPGNKEVSRCHTPLPHPPSSPQSHQIFSWIVIGLLAVTFLYSCVITAFCVIQRRSKAEPENSTYVEMRKAPPSRNPAFDIYCG